MSRVSVLAPPGPLWPLSSMCTVIVALPLTSAGGVNTRPSRALLSSARVPSNTMDASAVPSPAPKINPAVLPRVRVPVVVVRVSVRSDPPASRSLTVIALPLPFEKVRLVSSSTAWDSGTLTTGAPLTSATVMVTVPGVEVRGASQGAAPQSSGSPRSVTV